MYKGLIFVFIFISSLANAKISSDQINDLKQISSDIGFYSAQAFHAKLEAQLLPGISPTPSAEKRKQSLLLANEYTEKTHQLQKRLQDLRTDLQKYNNETCLKHLDLYIQDQQSASFLDSMSENAKKDEKKIPEFRPLEPADQSLVKASEAFKIRLQTTTELSQLVQKFCN